MDFLQKLKHADYLKPLKRFPISAGMAGLITILFITLIWAGDSLKSETITLIARMIFALSIAFMTVGAVQLFSERQKLTPPIKALATVVAFAASVMMALIVFPDVGTGDFGQNNLYQIIALLFMAVALPFTVPYLRSENSNSYWKFGSTLLRRVTLTIMFTFVMVLGLFLALGAVGFLLGVDIAEEWYPTIAVLGFALAVPYFSLMLVPDSFEEEVTEKDFPQTTFRFAQLVLIPLLVIYVMILYLYILKALVTGEVPSNQLVPLTLVFLFPGYLAVIGLFPLRDGEKYKWVKWFNRIFAVSVFPLVLAYFYGIGVRINEYGLTILRMYVVLVGLYILGAAIYLLAVKKPRLNYLLFSLPLILFLATFLPLLNVFKISEWHQYTLLENNLTEIGVLKDGKLTGEAKKIDYSRFQIIDNQLNYIGSAYGYSGMERWIDRSRLQQIGVSRAARFSNYGSVQALMGEFKLTSENGGPFNPYPPNNSKNQNFFIYSNQSNSSVVDIKGFDKYIQFNISNGQSIPGGITNYDGILAITTNGKVKQFDLEQFVKITVDFADQSSYRSYYLDKEELTIDDPDYVLVLDNINGDYNAETNEITRLERISGYVLVKD